VHQEIPAELDALARQVVDAALAVHKNLGPGLLESAYQVCLKLELEKRGVPCCLEQTLPIIYDGVVIEGAYRIDLIVGGMILLELKSVEKLLPIHTAQLVTYLKLSGKRLGFLINFNVPLIRDGIKRVAL
jgi:GxxExxY protein